ncbi:MAG TPA: hypothetical protein VHG91_07430 [Longimicrobium sp.]|nr:hypothetical protein [Longimicrobium sp.]
MRTRPALLLLALLPLFPAPSAAQAVSAENGNVVYTAPGAPPRRLTSNRIDSDPALSPDGRWVVFVRRAAQSRVYRPGAPTHHLYRIGVDGSGLTHLLTGRPDTVPERSLSMLSSPAVSPDGRTVYFMAAGWVTSGAAHALELETGRTRFVAPANELRVVPTGEYAGHLVVQQHRYFVGGGAYDWYWLLTPEGKEVGPLGESPDPFWRELVEKR